jgi:Na+/melibiose symporter-like transporter
LDDLISSASFDNVIVDKLLSLTFNTCPATAVVIPSRIPDHTATMALTSYLPFSSTTTPLQATTYLLGISLFSISFLVFLNSILPFVITDLLGIEKGVGDIVGTLGFVDEIVALVACPIWGLVSDRLGVRTVAVIGYSVIGLALFLFVQARNAYPQLLLARILFAVGATAAYVSLRLGVNNKQDVKLMSEQDNNGNSHSPFSDRRIVPSCSLGSST